MQKTANKPVCGICNGSLHVVPLNTKSTKLNWFRLTEALEFQNVMSFAMFQCIFTNTQFVALLHLAWCALDHKKANLVQRWKKAACITPSCKSAHHWFYFGVHKHTTHSLRPIIAEQDSSDNNDDKFLNKLLVLFPIFTVIVSISHMLPRAGRAVGWSRV